jgi:hypothetical protein
MVVNILGKAANAVAAHLYLAAVGVVDLHLEVGDFRRMNRKQLIRADPESSVAQLFCNRLQAVDVLLETIEKNEVVAATMHLGELDFHLAYCFEFRPTNRWFIVALAVSFLPG